MRPHIDAFEDGRADLGPDGRPIIRYALYPLEVLEFLGFMADRLGCALGEVVFWRVGGERFAPCVCRVGEIDVELRHVRRDAGELAQILQRVDDRTQHGGDAWMLLARKPIDRLGHMVQFDKLGPAQRHERPGTRYVFVRDPLHGQHITKRKLRTETAEVAFTIGFEIV